jgi:hypothetical protein
VKILIFPIRAIHNHTTIKNNIHKKYYTFCYNIFTTHMNYLLYFSPLSPFSCSQGSSLGRLLAATPPELDDAPLAAAD